MSGPSLDQDAIKARLFELESEHRDLDTAIDALTRQTIFDQLHVQRLKKRKLILRDEIAVLRDMMTPDIIA